MTKLLLLLGLSFGPLFSQVTSTGFAPNIIVTAHNNNITCTFDNSHFYQTYTYPGPVVAQVNYLVASCSDIGNNTNQQFTIQPSPPTYKLTDFSSGSFRYQGDYIFWNLSPNSVTGQPSLLVYFFHNGAYQFFNPIVL